MISEIEIPDTYFAQASLLFALCSEKEQPMYQSVSHTSQRTYVQFPSLQYCREENVSSYQSCDKKPSLPLEETS